MENLIDYIALRDMLPTSHEADFSMLPKEFDVLSPIAGTVCFTDEEKTVGKITKITLPFPIVPRYVHIDCDVLTRYLGIRKADISWLLRTRYCVRMVDGKPQICTNPGVSELQKDYLYTGAEAVEKLYDSIDPFEAAYLIEMRAFDPALSEEECKTVRERAKVTAAVASGVLRKEDFFLTSVPVLPFVTELAGGDPKEFFETKIPTYTYRLWNRARRLRELALREDLSKIILINESRMVQQAADRLLAEYKLAGIKFKNNHSG